MRIELLCPGKKISLDECSEEFRNVAPSFRRALRALDFGWESKDGKSVEVCLDDLASASGVTRHTLILGLREMADHGLIALDPDPRDVPPA